MYFVWPLWVESHKNYEISDLWDYENYESHKNYEISQMLELCEEEFRKSVQGYLLQANDCTYDRRLVNFFSFLVKMMNTAFLLFCK